MRNIYFFNMGQIFKKNVFLNFLSVVTYSTTHYFTRNVFKTQPLCTPLFNLKRALIISSVCWTRAFENWEIHVWNSVQRC